MKPSTRQTARLVGVALALCAAPASAASYRVLVSGHGIDAAGCGLPAAPCRTLQYAHDSIVAARGEIDILDPAGYGPLTITKALSVVNDGAGTAGAMQLASGQNAITINAGSGDEIVLRGLTLDGLNSGTIGVQILSAGKVTIENCAIRHFAANGVDATPGGAPLQLYLSGVTASGNGAAGIHVAPTGAASVNGVIASGATNGQVAGVFLDASQTTGSVGVSVVGGVAEGDQVAFKAVTSAAWANATMLLDHVVASDNGDGVATTGFALARITKSTLSRNGNGAHIIGAGGGIASAGDNFMAGNGVDVAGGTLTNVGLK